ncbi:MAG TPA: nitroreductase family protein, partial [Desulfobacteraceae bacterium]|nr:nitroreductase family protein [Desulfobacteraceae bacterium]
MWNGSMTDNESRIISVDELINNRRSIRKYKADMPPLQWIDKMIECAVKAPSPSNSQPVRFIRISSRKSKKDLYQAISSNRQKLLESVLAADKPKRLRNWINTYYRFSEFMFNAPLLFAIGTILPSTG